MTHANASLKDVAGADAAAFFATLDQTLALAAGALADYLRATAEALAADPRAEGAAAIRKEISATIVTLKRLFDLGAHGAANLPSADGVFRPARPAPTQRSAPQDAAPEAPAETGPRPHDGSAESASPARIASRAERRRLAAIERKNNKKRRFASAAASNAHSSVGGAMSPPHAQASS